MKLDEIKIYRMTHIGNITHILRYGITHKNSPKANPDFIDIGDKSLIDNRSIKVVNVDNGDFSNFDAPNIVLGDFIPFYFGVKMPMLYVIQNGGNFVEKATPAEKIIYLVCSIQLCINPEMYFYFSDGHATDNLSTFYDRTKIDELPGLIDWNAVKSSYWGGHENLNIKRKKQAEFLVQGDVPPDYLIGYGCYNKNAKRELIAKGVEESRIKVIPKAYYEI